MEGNQLRPSWRTTLPPPFGQETDEYSSALVVSPENKNQKEERR